MVAISSAQVSALANSGDISIAAWASSNVPGFGTDSDIFFARSTDNGHTFSASQPLNAGAAGAETIYDFRVSLAGDASQFVAAWVSNNTFGGTYTDTRDRVVAARSTDGGLTWSDPVPVNTSPGANNLLTFSMKIAGNGNGTYYTAWSARDTAAASQDLDLYVSRSSDGGQTWEAPVQVDSSDANEDVNDYTPSISVDGESGKVFVGWIQASSAFGLQPFKLVGSVSNDGGSTWSSPYTIQDNIGGLGLSTASAGAGNFAVAWESYRGLADEPLSLSQINTAFSTDGGLTFGGRAALHHPGTAALYPNIFREGNGYGVLFTSQENPDADLDVFYANCLAGGPWSALTTVINDAVNTTSDLQPAGLANDSVKLAVWFRGADTIVAATQDIAPPGTGSDVVVTKTCIPSAHTGETLGYFIKVTNSGSFPASYVTLSDTFTGPNIPTNITAPLPCVVNSQTITCALGSLGPGQSQEIIVNATAPQVPAGSASAQVVNSVTVEAGGDVNPANNTASCTTVVSNGGPVTDLGISMFSREGPVYVGDLVRYDVLVRNFGPEVSDSTIIQDFVPDNMTFVRGRVGRKKCTEENNVVTCSVGDLDVDKEKKVTIYLRAIDDGEAVNKVIPVGTRGDPNKANDESTVTKTIDWFKIPEKNEFSCCETNIRFPQEPDKVPKIGASESVSKAIDNPKISTDPKDIHSTTSHRLLTINIDLPILWDCLDRIGDRCNGTVDVAIKKNVRQQDSQTGEWTVEPDKAVVYSSSKSVACRAKSKTNSAKITITYKASYPTNLNLNSTLVLEVTTPEVKGGLKKTLSCEILANPRVGKPDITVE